VWHAEGDLFLALGTSLLADMRRFETFSTDQLRVHDGPLPMTALFANNTAAGVPKYETEGDLFQYIGGIVTFGELFHPVFHPEDGCVRRVTLAQEACSFAKYSRCCDGVVTNWLEVLEARPSGRPFDLPVAMPDKSRDFAILCHETIKGFLKGLVSYCKQ
jgi:hypothetical protein